MYNGKSGLRQFGEALRVPLFLTIPNQLRDTHGPAGGRGTKFAE